MSINDDLYSKFSALSIAEQIGQPKYNLGATEAILGLATNMKRITGSSSIVESMLNTRKQFTSFSSPIDYFMKPSKFYNHNMSIEEMVIRGSAAYLVNAFSAPSKASTLGILDFSKGIQDMFNQHPTALQKQLAITEQLTRGYFSAINSPVPYWADRIQSQEKENNDAISMFDMLTATTLNRITDVIDNAGGSEDIIDEVSQSLTHPQIQKQLDDFYLSISDLIERKFDEKKQDEVIETHILITHFIHDALFKNTRLSKQALQVAFDLIGFFVFQIFMQMFWEAKGKDIYDRIFSQDDVKKNQSIQINNTTVVNNYIIKSNPVDFSIEDASVYSGPSSKRKYKGRLTKGTTVEILKVKPQWCLIKGNVETKNKVTGDKNDTLILGWVMKKHLDGFQ